MDQVAESYIAKLPVQKLLCTVIPKCTTKFETPAELQIQKLEGEDAAELFTYPELYNKI